MTRLRNVARINPPTPQFDRLPDDSQVAFVPLEAVWPGSRFDASQTRLKGDVSTGYTRFLENDILIPKITPTFEADRTTIATGIEGGVAAATTELHIVRVGPEADLKYIRYLLSTSSFLQEGAASMIGVAGQKRVPDELLRNLIIPIPDLRCQRTIAAFLDGETTRIDALIALKQQMIDRLHEREASAVYATVVGDRIAGRRQSSGSPWLADCPASWTVAPLGARYRVELGRMLNEERRVGLTPKPYLRNANVRWDDFDVRDVASMDFPPAEQARFRLRVGDLLVCEGGAGIGRAAIWRGEVPDCYYQKSLHRIRPTSEWPVAWLLEWIRISTWLDAWRVEGNLATIPHLTAEQLRLYRVPFPNVQDCVLMLRDLGATRHALKKQRGILITQIRLLAERRQALVSAAVTGALEIPGVAVV